MNRSAVLRVLGQLLLFLAGLMLAPAAIGLLWAEPSAWWAFIRSAAVCFVLGMACLRHAGRGLAPGQQHPLWLAFGPALGLSLFLVFAPLGGASGELPLFAHWLDGLPSGPLGPGLELAVLVASLAAIVYELRRDLRDAGVHGKQFYRREGLATVGLAWILIGLGGALPFLLSGAIPNLADAIFESFSGFTTTGATILPAERLDALPHAFGFWRAFSHWIGGIGIVLVFVILFPSGGRSLFRSEVPGIDREASYQRVRDSAWALVRVYVGLTVIEVICYRFAGVSIYEGAIHAFSTMATGGFSSHSQSIGYFDSAAVEFITMVFMFLAGVNFAYYDTALRLGPKRGLRSLMKSSELRLYVGLLASAILIITVGLWFWGGSNGAAGSDLPDYSHAGRALRDVSFTVVSVETCTGYVTADFDRWPEFARVLLMILAFVGACAGSTGGGLKVVRLIVIVKASLRSFSQFARPRARLPLRLDGNVLDEGLISTVIGYGVMWMMACIVGTLALAFVGIDPVTGLSASLSCLNNFGPGLHLVGPTMDYGWMPAAGKLICVSLMVVGRLEFYALVVLFLPRFWRA